MFGGNDMMIDVQKMINEIGFFNNCEKVIEPNGTILYKKSVNVVVKDYRNLSPEELQTYEKKIIKREKKKRRRKEKQLEKKEKEEAPIFK